MRPGLLKINIFEISPLIGPIRFEEDQNYTCTARLWGQQDKTINGSLWYLVTEEMREQEVVYRRTDGQTYGSVSIELSWSRTVKL